MTRAAELQAQQIAHWNGESGDFWVAQQERMDAMLAPVGEAVVALAAPQPNEHAVDIGCGCGATALMLAEAVGPGGHVTGVDISKPMLGRARERAARLAQLAFIEADAGSHRFAPQSADLVFSRFGVMFFGDSTAAFTNIRTALKPNGRLVFACWRPLAENPWMNLPFQAALPHVDAPPSLPAPGDPGPYAFADPDVVTDILTVAGFAPPTFTKLDVTIDLADGGGLDVAVQQAMSIGAARRVLDGQPDAVRLAVEASIREALTPFLSGQSVLMAGAVWLVRSA